MLEQEEVIWTGQPHYKPRISILEIFGGGWGLVGVFLTIPFMSFLFYSVFCFVTNDVLFGSISAFIFIAIIFVPELMKRMRRNRTRYKVTSKRVFFDLWWWWEESSFEIPLSEIQKFYYVEFKDKSGHIHLIMKNSPEIRTRNFWSGLKKASLSFEDIPRVVEISEILNEALKKHKQSIS